VAVRLANFVLVFCTVNVIKGQFGVRSFKPVEPKNPRKNKILCLRTIIIWAERDATHENRAEAAAAPILSLMRNFPSVRFVGARLGPEAKTRARNWIARMIFRPRRSFSSCLTNRNVNLNRRILHQNTLP